MGGPMGQDAGPAGMGAGSGQSDFLLMPIFN